MSGGRVAVRILVSVAGHDFSWTPGELVWLPRSEAEKWCDGERAEYVAAQTPPPRTGRKARP